MKSTFLIIVLLAVASCNNTEKEIDKVKQLGFQAEYLEGYFPKNDIDFNVPVKTIVITKKEDLDKYFGIAKTMQNKVPSIDFDKNKIVALISAPSDRKQKIVITSTHLKNNKLKIRYKVIDGQETESFTSTDLKMFPIPKSVRAVDFSIDRTESETIKKEKP